ncbi:MAG: hypothetical protein A2171_00930 [Candidatus Levybacteria bacterium RBG_13_35_9]|nr:MAG: hypothetical protein A2171_00930 [Candidatus Levybacteria bacterium RBG_13_35_9]
MESSRESIFKTLLYYDIFDYPLKIQKIWQFLESSKIKRKNLPELLKIFQVPIYKSFFFLRPRKNIVDKRIARKKVSAKKTKKSEKSYKYTWVVADGLFYWN